METEIVPIRWSGGSKTAELHTDLIFEILTKLDVKTLSRCKRVCKRWNRVISSRGFINAHRRQSISRGLSDILFVHLDYHKTIADGGKGWVYKFTMVSDGTSTYNNNSNSIKYPYTFYLLPMASNCDLLCFVDLSGGSFMLCNPRTGQFQTIPKPPIACHYGQRGLVFGYVDSMRQYVLVGLFYYGERDVYVTLKFSFSSNYECECECDGDTSCSCSCSCSIASSSWKEIVEACPLGTVQISCGRIWSHGILVNNSVYWLDYGQRENGEIVSLEVENDKYKIISCPPQFKLTYPIKFHTLIDLKGTLAAALIDTSSLDIWVLEDQFNNSSHGCGWVRKYSINMANILAHPKDGYYVHSKSTRNGELIVTVKTTGLNKHYICNPENGSFRALIDPCSRFKCMTLGFFWESLFSFGVNSY